MARRFAFARSGRGYPFGLKRDGVKEVKEVSASLEVLGKPSGKAERKTILWRATQSAELMSITSEAEGR